MYSCFDVSVSGDIFPNTAYNESNLVKNVFKHKTQLISTLKEMPF